MQWKGFYDPNKASVYAGLHIGSHPTALPHPHGEELGARHFLSVLLWHSCILHCIALAAPAASMFNWSVIVLFVVARGASSMPWATVRQFLQPGELIQVKWY
jgi:hypothetical protein